MSRIVVGLLAGLGRVVDVRQMAALVGLVHGDLVPAMIISSGFGTGLAAYLALPNKKTILLIGFPGLNLLKPPIYAMPINGDL